MITNDYTPVQILDNDNFGVLFRSANPMRLSVVDEKRVTRFKVETGDERSDHIINNAIEINIEIIFTGPDTRANFQAMRQAYLENQLVIIQSRVNTYENMLIEAFPHEETQQIYDGIIIPARFIEWREVSAEYGELRQQTELTSEQVAEPAQTSTVRRGTQTGESVEPDSEIERKGSVLSGWELI